MLECSQRYVGGSQRYVGVQSEICWRYVGGSQRYVVVQSEICCSVTPEMVCCWQLENVVGSQRYVSGKQRYVGVQSEIFWSVVRDILECRYVAKKYVVLFFLFPELYIRVCWYIFRWYKETYCHKSFGIFWYFFYLTHTSRITSPKNIATNKSEHEKTETAIDLYIIYDSIHIMVREHSL